jgi:4-amino-4-deoxy-L-arabinose transferase-like glycosyltransferase
MVALYIKERWFLFLAITLFIVTKIPHLHYAFYWDESYVYVPASLEMFAHGPSLFPGAVPLMYSTGHPLLFYAACASWMIIFGTSNFSLHCFALTISSILAIVLYEILLRIFNKRVAIMGLSLLILSLNFYGTSSFVLSDIALALLAFLSLYCYIQEQYLLTALFLTLLFFTKESGLVLAVLIFIDTLILAVIKKITAKQILLRSMSVISPLILLLLFFIKQKRVYGWYLYPKHANGISLRVEDTFYNLRRSLGILFYYDHLYYFYILLLLLIAYLAIKRKSIKYSLCFLFFVFVYSVTIVFTEKDAIFYAFVGICFVGVVFFFLRPLPYFDQLQQRFIKVIVAFCLLFMYFCCINFFEERYVFPSLFMASVILLAVFFDVLILKISRQAFPFVVSAIIITGVANIYTKVGDLDSYVRMELHQHVVDYLEQNNFYDRNIACSFLEHVHLTDPKTGFLHNGRVFHHVRESRDNSTDLIIYDNIEPDPLYDSIKMAPAFYLLHRYQKGTAWVEVYAKK